MDNLQKLLNRGYITCFEPVAKELITNLNENNINYKYTLVFDGVYEISIKN